MKLFRIKLSLLFFSEYTCRNNYATLVKVSAHFIVYVSLCIRTVTIYTFILTNLIITHRIIQADIYLKYNQRLNRKSIVKNFLLI